MAALAFAALLLALGAAPPPDAETLGVIDNTLRHEAPPPRAAPAIVRELLARPLEARDAGAIFDRLVPRPIVDAAAAVRPQPPQRFERLLENYVAELVVARDELLVATGNAPIDEAALLADIRDHGHPSADRLLQVAAATDLDGLAVANERFIAATVRFAHALRTATDLPAATTRFETSVGTIVIGSQGDDVHELGPATGGAIAVVIDLGGNDTYKGTDVAVRGFSAIIDLAGNDRYEMSGPGLGAAVAGGSLVLDLGGDDSYRVPHAGQGFAAFGIGALLDLGGNDRYELGAWGQGFGLAGGLGLLWDVAGDDRYAARGAADAYDRGGGLSGAQGVAMGLRTLLPGGIGILRDDAGNDSYAAEMFAQGTGYYYGIGVLWDRGGDDRYQAVRYAQGNGVHEAVGVLRDDAGNDLYSLSFGVGQGMGLDLAVGALVDGAGDDGYKAGVLAQATATANGIGVLDDAAGADRFEIGTADRQWGHAQWWRGLPSVGVFLHDARASFVAGGKPLAAQPASRKEAEREEEVNCPAGVVVDPGELQNLRRDHFDSLYQFGGRLICALRERGDLWPSLDQELHRDPASPLAGAMAVALGYRRPPDEVARSVLAKLDAHPWCSVRAATLVAAPRADVARRALGSSCYRLQAAAVRALLGLGEPLPEDAPLPAFLR